MTQISRLLYADSLGSAAARTGMPYTVNPYPKDTEEHYYWHSGWQEWTTNHCPICGGVGMQGNDCSLRNCECVVEEA